MSGKDKLFTFRRRERPRNSSENCSARFLPDRPMVKSYPPDPNAKRLRMRNPRPRHVQELDRLLFCVGSASKAVCEQSSITDDLLSCMDEGLAKKVDRIAQFWLANQGDRLQRMQKWQFLHPTPYPGPISKDVYYGLFEYLGLNDDIVQNYFLARAKRCHKEDAVAFDPSTVSSYSRYIKETRQGFNKTGDGLDTVKLFTLFDLAMHQPTAFAREPGDISGIENALKQFSFLNISKAQKGYYSQSNIGQMLRKHIKFLTAASIYLSWVNHHLQKNKSVLGTASSLCPWDFNIHGITAPVEAEFSYQRQRNRGEAAKGDVLSETKGRRG